MWIKGACFIASGSATRWALKCSFWIKLILSQPPAITTDDPSLVMLLAPIEIAIKPDEHWRSTVIPETDTGKPEAIAAWRPRFIVWVPCCIAAPIMQSSISAGSTPARATAAVIACELIEGDWRLLNAPRNALPIGVRAAETITASFIMISLV